MKKFTKIMAMVLALALTAAMSVGLTMAYLTDTDEDVNVMTLGNVKIKQNEYEWNEDGTKLVDFTQAKPLLPYVGAQGWKNTDYADGAYRQFTMNNALDKYVTVENTGKSDAYVRTVFAFEMGELTADEWDTYLGMALNADVGATYSFSGSWTWEGLDLGTIAEIDGHNYMIYVGTHKDALAAGEETVPSLLQVYMTNTATNEIVEKLDGDGNGAYDILVVSQAVQAQGFADAQTALDTAFGDITTTNHPWSNTVIVETDDETEIMNALTSGKDVIVSADIVAIDDASFDGKDAKVTLAGVGADGTYGYLAFAPGASNNTDVKNITATGSGFVEVGHYGEGGGTYTVENLTVEDMTATLCVTNLGDKVAAAFCHYGNATLTDCVMTGTVSVDPDYTAYDAGFVNGTNTTISGGEYGKIYLWHQAYVTIEDAEIDVIDSCAINYKYKGEVLGNLTIKAGTHVGTINLTPGSFTPALVIEEGATVDAIVYNGVTYTQAEWLAR